MRHPLTRMAAYRMRPNDLRPTSLTLPTSGGGFDLTATNHHVLRTSLGTFHVSTTEGRFGWPVAGSRCWVAQLLADDPGLEEVGDGFAMTEREALDVLARAVRRYGARQRRLDLAHI